ncbi:MAG: NTP transferase domain-containing protein [Isosphaeraceae bacterium]
MIAAIVPAAGRSVRMGRPKLLMEFDGRTLIRRVVEALREGGVDRVVVVSPADGPDPHAIRTEAAAGGAEVVVPPIQPAEMRDSIELGIVRLDVAPRPVAVALTPGDVPGLTPALVTRLLRAAREQPDRLVIPAHEGRRGHPIVLPWDVALQVRELPADRGVNALVERYRERIVELALSNGRAIVDVDTLADLERWSAEAGEGLAVRVRMFALARERAGSAEVEVAMAASATVGDLRAALAAGFPGLAPLCAGALIAVDEEYAGDETPISAGSRIALIPPVSGGAGPARGLLLEKKNPPRGPVLR